MELENEIVRLCAANEFMNHNHIVLKELEKDRAIMELTVCTASLNPYGFVHGGALYTMADCACGTAARSGGGRYVTQTSNLTFHRSGMPGDVIRAEGKVLRRGHSTCCVNVELTNQKNDLLASGSFIFFRID